jgi:hypothetical protein
MTGILVLEKSVRRGRKTWSWQGKDSDGNVFILAFPRSGSGIGGFCTAVLEKGSQVPKNDFIKDGRVGRNVLLHKSLVGSRKQFWDLIESESKSSSEVALSADHWVITYLMEGVVEKAVDWLVSRGPMTDGSDVTENDVKEFKLRLLDVYYTPRKMGISCTKNGNS